VSRELLNIKKKDSMKTHKDLEVWKQSISFVTEIYKITKHFPKEELYGITSQMRKAAVSIPSNVSEGAARNSKKEFLHFLHISLGSAAELETQLIISQNLKYLDEPTDLFRNLEDIKRMLSGLIKSLMNNLNESN
jgi:four helix bundle protein